MRRRTARKSSRSTKSPRRPAGAPLSGAGFERGRNDVRRFRHGPDAGSQLRLAWWRPAGAETPFSIWNVLALGRLLAAVEPLRHDDLRPAAKYLELGRCQRRSTVRCSMQARIRSSAVRSCASPGSCWATSAHANGRCLLSFSRKSPNVRHPSARRQILRYHAAPNPAIIREPASPPRSILRRLLGPIPPPPSCFAAIAPHRLHGINVQISVRPRL